MSDIDLKALRDALEYVLHTGPETVARDATIELTELVMALESAERRAEEAEKERARKLTHAQRIEGLGREDLKNLKAQIDRAIAEIEEAGKVDMWVVSTPWLNLHWDTSYTRACRYLGKLLEKASAGQEDQQLYELTHQRVWASELVEYEGDYGKHWAALQAELDAAMAQEGGK